MPVLADIVKSVILREKPDGVIVSMGGQTALSDGIQLWNCGTLQEHNAEVLGTQIPVIEAIEDREVFSEKLKEIDETIALSYLLQILRKPRKLPIKLVFQYSFAQSLHLEGSVQALHMTKKNFTR